MKYVGKSKEKGHVVITGIKNHKKRRASLDEDEQLLDLMYLSVSIHDMNRKILNSKDHNQISQWVPQLKSWSEYISSYAVDLGVNVETGIIEKSEFEKNKMH